MAVAGAEIKYDGGAGAENKKFRLRNTDFYYSNFYVCQMFT